MLKNKGDFLRENAGKKPATVNHYLKHIRLFLGHAQDQGHLSENPGKEIKRLKEDKNPIRFLSIEEVNRLVEAVQDSPIYPIVMTALHTGCRIREITNLEWTDFDFNRRVLTVRNKTGFQTKSRNFYEPPRHEILYQMSYPLQLPKKTPGL